jgi:hypothetical protein
MTDTAVAPAEVTRFWLGTCPQDGVTIGVKTEGEVRTDVGGDAAREPDQADRYRSACLCGAAITLRPVSEAEYVAELGDHDDDDDEPVDLLEDEDGAPFPDVVQRAHRWAVEAQLRELAEQAERDYREAVTAAQGAPAGAEADYWRWNGHAEAQRAVATRIRRLLGDDVPEYGSATWREAGR